MLLQLRRRRPQLGPQGTPVLGGYRTPSGFHRHRRLLLVTLIGICLLWGAVFGLVGQFLMVPMLLLLTPLVGLVIWMLPDSNAISEVPLERLMFAYVAALLVWPDYLAIVLPGLPWLTALRLVGIPMALVLLITLSQNAVAREGLKRTLGQTPQLWQLMAAFAFIALYSCALSATPMFSLNKYVTMLLNWVAPFFVGAIVLAKPGRIRTLAIVLWAIALIVSIPALYEVFYKKIWWAGRIPSFLKVEGESVQRILAGTMRAYTDKYRVQSRFTTSLGFAEFLAYVLPFILHLTVTGDRRMRFAGVATIPFLFYMTYMTDARSGMIGFFATLLLYLLAWALIRWRTRPESVFGPAITLAYPAIATGFLAATFVIGRLRRIVWGTGAQASSTDARQQMYEMGMPMIMNNPIGHGLGRGAETLGFVAPDGLLTIDTYYLSIALELGVLGFLVYFGMFAFAMVRSAFAALDARSADTTFLIPISIALFNFILIKSVLSQQENHPLAFLLLGGSAALIARAVAERNARASDSGPPTGLPVQPPPAAA